MAAMARLLRLSRLVSSRNTRALVPSPANRRRSEKTVSPRLLAASLSVAASVQAADWTNGLSVVQSAVLGGALLAARADVPAEDLRRRFPSQLKIGPVEKIRDLVNLQLPGVPVHAVPVAPRQIPYHAGFVYFELDQSHELWGQLKTSGGVAMHVAGEFPNLAMEFWAIRS